MANPNHVLGLAATDTDAGAGGVGEAIPTEVFSQFTLEALYSNRLLAGAVGAVNEDLTASAGDNVKVTAMAARSAQGPISEGTALTDTASTISSVAITLQKYGDYDIVNREAFEDQDLWSQEDFLRNMAEALAEKVDQEVYDALEGASATSSELLATAGSLSDLYDKIVDLKATMMKLKVRPSHIVIGPDQEAQLLKDTSEGIKLTQITAGNGSVQNVAGLSVIVTPLANAGSATLNEVQAIMLDRSRALAEVWGRRPDTTVDEVSRAEFDQVKLVTWIRYATEVIDLDAVGHIANPAA